MSRWFQLARVEIKGEVYLYKASDPTAPESAVSFRVKKEQALAFYKNGQEAKFYELDLIKEVLLFPTAIFIGLRRPGYETAFCYCGKPAR